MCFWTYRWCVWCSAQSSETSHLLWPSILLLFFCKKGRRWSYFLNIFIAGGYVFVSGENGCSAKNGGCSQLCLPTSESARSCSCTAGFTLDAHDQMSCLPINSTLLFSSGSEISGISLDPTQLDELLPPISKISVASAMDFYAGKKLARVIILRSICVLFFSHFVAESFIYWVDSKTSSLNRVRRDLTGRQVVIENDLNSVDQIAVDWIAGKKNFWLKSSSENRNCNWKVIACFAFTFLF